MPGHDIIVIGASAGGVEAILQLARTLPPDLPAAVFVVVHISPLVRSVLPALLQKHGPLPAAHGQDNEPVQLGRIYVAPPDHHLSVHRDVIRVTRGPHENGFRPAVDTLFRSAARAFGPRVVGVVLSGTLDDGTAGLEVIKQHGGIAIVQDPAEAVFPGMPQSALDNVAVDHVLPLHTMAPVFMQLAQEPVVLQENITMPNKTKKNSASSDAPDTIEPEDTVRQDMAAQERGERRGRPSVFTCPECGGVVWEHEEGGVLRYNCHVGHAYSAESFLAEQSDKLEEALWTALRALEESASVRRRLATRMERQGQHNSASRFRTQAESSHQHANVLREVLENMQLPAQPDNEEITMQEMQRLERAEAE